MGDRGHNRHGPKRGWAAVPLPRGEGAGSPSNTMIVAWAEVYFRTKWHLDPSSRLTTTDMGRNLGAPPPFGGRGAGSPSNIMSLGLRPTSLPSGILIYPEPFGHNRYGPKIGELCPFGGGEAGSPSSTMWPGPRPILSPCQLAS